MIKRITSTPIQVVSASEVPDLEKSPYIVCEDGSVYGPFTDTKEARSTYKARKLRGFIINGPDLLDPPYRTMWLQGKLRQVQVVDAATTTSDKGGA